MRYLGLGLFAEGMRDHSFLRPLLRRTAEQICLSSAEPVELGDVLELHTASTDAGKPRSERIAHAAERAAGGIHVLLVHTDAGSDQQRACEERVAPSRATLAQRLSISVVGVVPIRETEAWALVDGDALRIAFGAAIHNSSLGVPDNPRDVEAIKDPKRALEDAYSSVLGGRRKRNNSGAFLKAIGERISLDRLRQVPSFASFEAKFRIALREQRII